MRLAVLALLLALPAPLAAASDAEFDKFFGDASRQKALKEGFRPLKKYFKLTAMVDAGKTKYETARDKEMSRFLKWLDGTEKSLGLDLRANPFLLLEIFDRARIDSLARARNGKIDYIRVENARGMARFEYAVLTPQKYNTKERRYPLVVTLHERVINPKHPAFRSTKNPNERARVVVYNNWFKTPAAEQVVIIAPTGGPNGFLFKRNPQGDLQTLYRSMGAGLTNYRTDWNKVFLEVSGPAMRVCFAQSLMFAGFVVREREGTSKLPIPEEEFFMLENLNGTPMLYIADNANWKKVGKPMTTALQAAYAKAGVPNNLVVMRDDRDGNGALKGDPEVIAGFLAKHSRPRARKEFKWRYFEDAMTSPLPVTILGANYAYDEKPALKDKAGSLLFKVSQEKYKDKQGNQRMLNVIDISVTESQSLTISLYDGLVNLSHPVTVRINGKIIRDKVMLKRDWSSFVKDVLPLRFFMLPFVAELKCDYEGKPQYVPPPPKKKKGDAKKGDAKKDDAKKDDAKKGDAEKGDAEKGDAEKGG